MALVQGTMIDGRYEVVSPLGQGGHGEVYEVVDHTQQQTVALKLLDPQVCGPWPWREAVELTRLRSDYILPVWNASIANGVPYIVTELARGGTADRLCSTLPRAVPAVAIRTIRHAARGAARTHDDGVVHRDIKLENIFLDTDSNARLGDFGIAHPLVNGAAPPHGTLVTMAPEVLTGANTGVESDIYSLGCSLYCMVTGWYPYLDLRPATEQEFVALVAAQPPTPVRELAPHVTRALAARVERAMSRDPADRYRSAAELDAHLGQLPPATRHWHEVPAHPGHDRCWESMPPPRDAVRVCVIPAPVGRGSTIEAARMGTGNRIRPSCRANVRPANVLAALRSTFEQLGN